jgi:hypothetical protein
VVDVLVVLVVVDVVIKHCPAFVISAGVPLIKLGYVLAHIDIKYPLAIKNVLNTLEQS